MPKKQTEIPGTQRKRDKQISAAAKQLYDLRADRTDAQRRATEASENLVAAMRKKGVSVYVDEELAIRCLLKEGDAKVSVQKIKADE
jgi:hypothetical protein